MLTVATHLAENAWPSAGAREAIGHGFCQPEDPFGEIIEGGRKLDKIMTQWLSARSARERDLLVAAMNDPSQRNIYHGSSILAQGDLGIFEDL